MAAHSAREYRIFHRLFVQSVGRTVLWGNTVPLIVRSAIAQSDAVRVPPASSRSWLARYSLFPGELDLQPVLLECEAGDLLAVQVELDERLFVGRLRRDDPEPRR